MEDRWLSTKEVGERLNSTPESTVRYWRSIGYGPPGTKFGRRVLYRESSFLAWQKELEAAEKAARVSA
jgi:DNA-binding transcriptional MerR regulator